MNQSDDGGLSVADEARIVRIYRAAKIARTVVILAAIGVGTAVAVAIAVSSGMLAGGVDRV